MKEILQNKLGFVEIETNDNVLKAINFGKKNRQIEPVNYFQRSSEVYGQLQQYFDGERKEFYVKIDITSGTAWQQKVWRELMKIPWGETVTYGELAKKMGNSGWARAVGMGCKTNPIPIVIPCHRVVSKGGLGGYSGGLKRKKWLLNHENAVFYNE